MEWAQQLPASAPTNIKTTFNNECTILLSVLISFWYVHTYKHTNTHAQHKIKCVHFNCIIFLNWVLIGRLFVIPVKSQWSQHVSSLQPCHTKNQRHSFTEKKVTTPKKKNKHAHKIEICLYFFEIKISFANNQNWKSLTQFAMTIRHISIEVYLCYNVFFFIRWVGSTCLMPAVNIRHHIISLEIYPINSNQQRNIFKSKILFLFLLLEYVKIENYNSFCHVVFIFICVCVSACAWKVFKLVWWFWIRYIRTRCVCQKVQ